MKFYSIRDKNLQIIWPENPKRPLQVMVFNTKKVLNLKIDNFVTLQWAKNGTFCYFIFGFLIA